MKKFITLTTVALLCIFLMDAKEIKEHISKNQLPEISQAFILKHFASTPIIGIAKETNGRKNEYKVRLDGGIELKFEKNGEWEEVDAENTEIPAEIVPDEIQSAVNSKYPQSFIVQIERKKSGWEVELDDGTEIKFNTSFKITDIDR